MNRMLVAVFLVLSSLGLSGCGTYDWHQKMTVEVETPLGVKSGSAITSVSWWKNEFFKDGAALQSSIKGEAAVVDLGGGHYLFALLSHADDSGYMARLAPRIVVDRDQLVWSLEAITRAKALSGPLEVPPKHFPMLVTFTDINDPKSVKEVNPANLGATFGAGYALQSLTLEVTDEPVLGGKIESLLNWLSAYPEPGLCKPSNAGIIPFCRKIHHGDLIRR
ncbi:MAG: hypothetical protein JNK83_05420 [Rhizobiales bacterium]|jgi:hypothetical protein|nr:hypothetical protein [Hyphomicrobiales bacterium]